MNFQEIKISFWWCFVSGSIFFIQLAQTLPNQIGLEYQTQNEAYETVGENILSQLEDINNKLSDTSSQFPKDCCSVQLTGGNTSGIYSIFPFESYPSLPIKVYCDLNTNNGGWTVFQRRENATGPTVDFKRGWEQYVIGFGNVSQSFWLGLRAISAMSEKSEQSLRVELTDWEDESKYAEYEFFKVGSYEENYTLLVGGYAGNAGDALAVHDGMAFSTRDRDNDMDPRRSCSRVFQGAWWYTDCYRSSLNGVYKPFGQHTGIDYGIHWQTLKAYSLKGAEMKIRPRQFDGGCSSFDNSNE